MRIRVFERAGALLAAICLLSGCAREDTAAVQSSAPAYPSPVYEWQGSGGKTLTIWASENELNRIYMQRAFSRYKQLTGNSLRIVEMPKGVFETETAQAFRGQGEKPDLILSYGGTNIAPYRPDDNFYDFTDAVWVDDLTSTSINQTIYNGRIIGLPHWEASISGILYNKKLFNRFGIDVPESQDEFLAACEALSSHGITPVYLPYSDPSMMFYQFPLDTLVQDSQVLSGLNDGSLNYADLPQMETILNWYRTMNNRGYFGTDYEDHDWDGMSEALKSGKYGMMVCWDTWLYTDFSGDPGDFGIMPAFMGVPEAGTFEGPNLALLIVNKNSPRLDTALRFIDFMADPYNYNAAFDEIYTAPVFKHQVSNIATPQYVEAERLIEKNFHDSTAWLRIRGFSQLDAGYIQRYMTSGDEYTVQDCLKDMDEARKKRISE